MGLLTAPTCTLVDANTLRFDNPFENMVYEGNTPVQIAFRNRVLPGANLMI